MTHLRRFSQVVILVTVAALLAVPAYEAWRVSKFNRVHIGMSRAEVAGSLGPPDSKSSSRCFTDENCSSGECWLYKQLIFEHLVVHFGASGRVICRDVYRPEIRASG
jgi:hypothetical protein